MIKEAIEYILGQSAPVVKEINGKSYLVTRNESKPIIESVKTSLLDVENLEGETLTGLTDFIGLGEVNPEQMFIHVVDEYRVQIVSRFNANMRRDVYFIAAKNQPAEMKMEKLDGELFRMKLITMFSPNPERHRLEKIIASVTDVSEVITEDNGVSQKMSVRTSISNKEGVLLENPFDLFPICSFPEIEVPFRPYYFRITKSAKGELEYSLYEIECPGWKARLILVIGEWLREELPAWTVIA